MPRTAGWRHPPAAQCVVTTMGLACRCDYGKRERARTACENHLDLVAPLTEEDAGGRCHACLNEPLTKGTRTGQTDGKSKRPARRDVHSVCSPAFQRDESLTRQTSVSTARVSLSVCSTKSPSWARRLQARTRHLAPNLRYFFLLITSLCLPFFMLRVPVKCAALVVFDRIGARC